MLKFYCHVLGEDYEVVKKQSPESKRKIQLLGSVIWLPVSLWTITVFVFSSHFFHASLLLSVGAGLFAGLVILIIERAIVLSKSNSIIRYFRIALGLIMAVLGSILLDEVLFASDIRQQKLNDLREIYGHVSSEEQQLVTVINELNQAYQNKLREAQSEAQGKGSGQKGVGKITMMISSQAEEMKLQLEQKESQLSLLRVDKKTEFENKQQAIISGATDSQMISNIQALFKFVSSSWSSMFLFGLVFIVLTFIECLVILFKSLSKKTSYERYLDYIEEINKNRLIKMKERQQRYYDPIVENQQYKQAVQLISKSQKSIF